jgi:hypothetical protein
VKTIEDADEVLKMVADYGTGPYNGWNTWWVWDGKDANGNPVSDGKYKLVITAKAPKIFNKMVYDAPQVIEFPVSVDRVAPTVKITSIVKNADGSYTISWNPANDPAPSSGIWGYDLVINGGSDILIAPDQTSYTTPVLDATTHYFTLYAIDNANNVGYDEGVLKYTITASVNNNAWGTITPSGSAQVEEYKSQSFVITPNPGYHIADILVDGGSIFAVGGRPRPSIETTSYTYTFSNVTSDHTIQAVFAPGVLQYVITASAGTGGTITPSGDVFVPQFGSQTFTITPNTGYHIKDVVVDGSTSVLSDVVDNHDGTYSYTFNNVDNNHTITVYFEHNYIKITSSLEGQVFSPTDTVTVSWQVAGFTGTEGKIRVLFFGDASSSTKWTTVAYNLPIQNGSVTIDLSKFTISDPLRCKVRVGIYIPDSSDPKNGLWFTWTSGTYFDETGYFWVIAQ